MYRYRNKGTFVSNMGKKMYHSFSFSVYGLCNKNLGHY